MKASSIAVGETYTLHVKDANGEPMHDGGDEHKPVEIVIYGPGTKQYRKAKSDQQNRLVALLQKKGGAKQSPESRMKNDAEFLADITASMTHLEDDDEDGKPLTGRALAVAVYSNPRIGFIGEQVHEAAHDWANFSKPSLTI